MELTFCKGGGESDREEESEDGRERRGGDGKERREDNREEAGTGEESAAGRTPGFGRSVCGEVAAGLGPVAGHSRHPAAVLRNGLRRVPAL